MRLSPFSSRRGVLRGGILALLALQFGACSNSYEAPAAAGTEDVPIAGYTQFDMLYEIYGDNPPSDALAFQVRRNGEFVYPDDSEFQVDPEDGTWIYRFKDSDDMVAFFPIQTA